MNIPHPHAEAMRLYAEDAAEAHARALLSFTEEEA